MTNSQTRMHHAALRHSRTRASDDDMAELEAIEDKCSMIRELLFELPGYLGRAAKRLNNAQSADAVRRFDLAIRDIERDFMNARKEDLTDAFLALADDYDAAAARLVAGYEAEAAE